MNKRQKAIICLCTINIGVNLGVSASLLLKPVQSSECGACRAEGRALESQCECR